MYTKINFKLEIEDFCCEDNRIYFVASVPHIIGEYDFQSGILNVLFDYSKTISEFRPFTRMVKYRHKIYCIPCYAESIYCYNMHSNQFYRLDIPDTLFQKMPKRKIIEAIVVEGLIYCISRSPHMVLVLEAETDKYDFYSNSVLAEEHDFFSIVVKDNCIKYPLFQNLIVSFEIKERTFRVEKIFDTNSKDKGEYIYHFLYDEMGTIWICNHKGDVYWVKNDRAAKIELPQRKKYVRYLVSEMLYQEGKIYFVQSHNGGHDVLKYTIRNGRFEWLETGNCQQLARKEICFDSCKIWNDMLCIYRFDYSTIYIWNLRDEFLKCFDSVISWKVSARLGLSLFYIESAQTQLELYLNYIQNDSQQSVINDNRMVESVGDIIYKYSHK